LAIIGGSGLSSLKMLEIVEREIVHTPYGEPSSPLVMGTVCGKRWYSCHGTAPVTPFRAQGQLPRQHVGAEKHGCAGA